MSRAGKPLTVEWSGRFEKRLGALADNRRQSCLRAIEAIAHGQATPGMRVRPILPSKFYSEARIASGDRLVFRVAEGVLYLIDVVEHDDIARYAAERRGR